MKYLISSLLLCFVAAPLAAEPSPRLLVCVNPAASFTAQELAARTKAAYVEVEQRNPYAALIPQCLEKPVVVINYDDPSPLIKKIRRLAHRGGYRYLNFVSENLDQATEKTIAAIKTSPKASSELYHTSLEDSKRLYELHALIHEVFVKADINYWAGRGTLLGAVRHQGMMPWEDYHVLHLLDKDEEKLKTLEPLLEESGLVLDYNKERDFYKIFMKNGDIIVDPLNSEEILPIRFPVADLFVMTLDCRHEEEDIYVHRSWFFNTLWNTEKFSHKQILGIHKVSFGPQFMPIPSEPELSLNLIYGMKQAPDLWKKYALEPFWDHKIESDHAWPGNSLVEIDDFSPSPWQ